MYRYEVTKVRPPFTFFDLYGIAAQREENGAWITASVVAPFSKDREPVERLAARCTSIQPCPEHLIEAVSELLPQAAAQRSAPAAGGSAGSARRF